jgi:hypothetical protein
MNLYPSLEDASLKEPVVKMNNLFPARIRNKEIVQRWSIEPSAKVLLVKGDGPKDIVYFNSISDLLSKEKDLFESSQSFWIDLTNISSSDLSYLERGWYSIFF